MNTASIYNQAHKIVVESRTHDEEVRSIASNAALTWYEETLYMVNQFSTTPAVDSAIALINRDKVNAIYMDVLTLNRQKEIEARARIANVLTNSNLTVFSFYNTERYGLSYQIVHEVYSYSMLLRGEHGYTSSVNGFKYAYGSKIVFYDTLDSCLNAMEEYTPLSQWNIAR